MKDLSNCTVMIVDDAEANIDLLVEILGDDYRLSVATDGESALEFAVESPPDLILLDIMMPGMDGYEVCRRIKADKGLNEIPVIFFTSMDGAEDEARGLKLGGIDYLTKPVSPPIVKARVRNHLELKLAREELESQNAILETKVQERTRDLAHLLEVTIESMASLAETRVPESGRHIQRTQYYVKALAEYLKGHPEYGCLLDDNTIDTLHKSAPLHDIGKVGVPDHILLKPARLTVEEFEEMKKHTIHGRNAILRAEKRLGHSSFLRLAREIAYTHHEKWNGTGYPVGLKGGEIPLSGRLMALADVYDALISHRTYKPRFPHDKAAAIIKEGRGSHFDPVVVEAFLNIQDEFMRIAIEFADND